MTPIALSLLTFALTGCGEGEDAIFGSGNNEITVSSFEGNANNIARINETYQTGAHNSEVINIVGNYNSQGVNTLDKTVLMNSFEGMLENKYIEVNGLTVRRPIYLKNSNTALNYKITYNKVDLSGRKADSYKAGNNINSSSGIRTALNTYSKITSTPCAAAQALAANKRACAPSCRVRMGLSHSARASFGAPRRSSPAATAVWPAGSGE